MFIDSVIENPAFDFNLRALTTKAFEVPAYTEEFIDKLLRQV